MSGKYTSSILKLNFQIP